MAVEGLEVNQLVPGEGTEYLLLMGNLIRNNGVGIERRRHYQDEKMGAQVSGQERERRQVSWTTSWPKVTKPRSKAAGNLSSGLSDSNAWMLSGSFFPIGDWLVQAHPAIEREWAPPQGNMSKLCDLNFLLCDMELGRLSRQGSLESQEDRDSTEPLPAPGPQSTHSIGGALYPYLSIF